jgi:predicted CXXCH cytochrome family protein
MQLSRSLKPVMILTVTLVLLLVSLGIAAAAVDCFSCHERNDFKKRVNHAPAAKGDCLSCHNPHVARFSGLLQEEVHELCYSCHTEMADEHSQGVVHVPVKKGE